MMTEPKQAQIPQLYSTNTQLMRELSPEPQEGYYDIVGIMTYSAVPQFIKYMFNVPNIDRILFTDEATALDARLRSVVDAGSTSNRMSDVRLPFISYYTDDMADTETQFRRRRNHPLYSQGMNIRGLPVPVYAMPIQVKYTVLVFAAEQSLQRRASFEFNTRRNEDDAIRIGVTLGFETESNGEVRRTTVDTSVACNFSLKQFGQKIDLSDVLYKTGIRVEAYTVIAEGYEIKHVPFSHGVGTMKNVSLKVIHRAARADKDTVVETVEWTGAERH